MTAQLRFLPAAQRRVQDAEHLAAIQRAFLEPVECHPSDEDMGLVLSVMGKHGEVQTRIGADGTRVDVAWGVHGPARIIDVSPPGGDG